MFWCLSLALLGLAVAKRDLVRQEELHGITEDMEQKYQQYLYLNDENYGIFCKKKTKNT